MPKRRSQHRRFYSEQRWELAHDKTRQVRHIFTEAPHLKKVVLLFDGVQSISKAKIPSGDLAILRLRGIVETLKGGRLCKLTYPGQIFLTEFKKEQ